MASQALLHPDDELTEDDQSTWGNLLDQVKLGDSYNKTQQSEVAPKPGFCVKTKNKGGEKVFLNICTTDSIPEPKKKTLEELLAMLESEDEMVMSDYRIPMSIGETAHAEVDKKGAGVSVYDVAIHPNYVTTIKAEPAFFNFFLQVVFEGLTAKFSIELEWDWIILKNRTHIGRIKPHVIRTYLKPVITEVKEEKKAVIKNTSKPKQHAPKPDYIVFQVPHEGPASHIIVEMSLPGVESSSKLTLDVGEDRLTLHAHPARYLLDVEVPYNVVPLESVARFDTHTGILTTVLTCEGAEEGAQIPEELFKSLGDGVSFLARKM